MSRYEREEARRAGRFYPTGAGCPGNRQPNQNDDLVRRFADVKAAEIRKLWEDFLQEVAVEKVVEQSPEMQVGIRTTLLSTRVKNTLECNDVYTIGELLQYSPAELRKFR
jgi:DNA-directed RNA polymerase alpha subunit